MTRKLLIGLLICLCVACGDDTAGTFESKGPGTVSELIRPLPSNTSKEINSDDLHIRIEALADDAFQGRAPGTPTGEGAATWIAKELARTGVMPGNNGEFFQPVEMVEMLLNETASEFKISREGKTVDNLVLGQDAVMWTKRQTDQPVELNDSELIFVGYGIVAPEYDWNDYADIDVSGKTVVMLINDPGYVVEDPRIFKGRSMTYYGRWTYKFEEAARQGAAGAIIVHQTAPASYGWDVVANSWSGPQADLIRQDGGKDRAALEAWISKSQADALFAEAGLDFETLSEVAATPGFSAIPMAGLAVSAQLHQHVSKSVSRNVIGVIPGTMRPDEHVMYVAHWDHLGRQDSLEPGADEIYNGAVDNATGVAAILEIAEAFAADPPERSILILAVTLEESGLLGSTHYANNPTVSPALIAGGINIDAMQPIGPTRDIIVIGFGASELEERLERLAMEDDRIIVPDPNPEAGYFYRSDHVSFAKVGVPMLYADGGIDMREGGKAAGEAFARVYTAQRYHKPSDEYDPAWDLRGMVEDTGLLYRLGRELADSTDWPQWYEGSEFRGRRDASQASTLNTHR